MADVVTETNVVQVTLLDAAGYVRTISLDNPKSNLTLNQIKNAFQSAISGGWLYGRSDIVVDVQKANYSTATKIPIGGAEVVIAPNSYTATTFSESANTAFFTIENANFISAMPSDFSVSITPPSGGSSNIAVYRNAGISEDRAFFQYLVLVNRGGTTVPGDYLIKGSGILKVTFTGGSLDIPITFNGTFTYSG